MRKVPFDISYLVNVHSLSNFSPQHGFFFFFLNQPSVNEGKYCFLIYVTCSLRH